MQCFSVAAAGGYVDSIDAMFPELIDTPEEYRRPKLVRP
jgi:hypothetical protein